MRHAWTRGACAALAFVAAVAPHCRAYSRLRGQPRRDTLTVVDVQTAPSRGRWSLGRRRTPSRSSTTASSCRFRGPTGSPSSIRCDSPSSDDRRAARRATSTWCRSRSVALVIGTDEVLLIRWSAHAVGADRRRPGTTRAVEAGRRRRWSACSRACDGGRAPGRGAPGRTVAAPVATGFARVPCSTLAARLRRQHRRRHRHGLRSGAAKPSTVPSRPADRPRPDAGGVWSPPRAARGRSSNHHPRGRDQPPIGGTLTALATTVLPEGASHGLIVADAAARSASSRPTARCCVRPTGAAPGAIALGTPTVRPGAVTFDGTWTDGLPAREPSRLRRRFVAFASTASDVVAGDTNALSEVRAGSPAVADVTRERDRRAAGCRPAVPRRARDRNRRSQPDGRYVLFLSLAPTSYPATKLA